MISLPTPDRHRFAVTMAFAVQLATLTGSGHAQPSALEASPTGSPVANRPTFDPQSNVPNPLVFTQRGDLPIILSAPHGGRSEIPGVPRRRGEGVAQFKTKADSRTGELARALSSALEKQMGKKPYVVTARFHRRYLDANRPPENAYESQAAKATYDQYHETLAAARREILGRWGSGILLDIHGQAADPNAIFRGTQNGKTTTYLVGRFGNPALVGPDSLFGRLRQQGFLVHPDIGSERPEDPRYSGGHIVRRYGSGPAEPFDAIQLELGITLRSERAIPSTAEKLAVAISRYAEDFLPRHEAANELRVAD